MGWRKDMMAALQDHLIAEQSTISNVQIWNKDLEAGLESGKMPKAPFILLIYSGFETEPLGNARKRNFTIPVIVGIKNLRGEQAAFKQETEEAARMTFDEVLELMEEVFEGWSIKEQNVELVSASPIWIGDETYLGVKDGVEVWGLTLNYFATFGIVRGE